MPDPKGRIPFSKLSDFCCIILVLRYFHEDFCGDPLYLEGNDRRRKDESLLLQVDSPLLLSKPPTSAAVHFANH